ncbi:MAG: polysaccharide pyruvyl transferase family protein [Acidobacteriaceae bacterium]
MNALLANDTRGSVPGEHWGSWRTTTNLEALLNRSGVTVVDNLGLGQLQPDGPIWNRIEKADMLVVNGEGSVHSRTRTAVAILSALVTANQRGIPVWIVNHACWDCDELIPNYAHADFIAVRDISSKGYLAQFGISARLAADCSFLSPPAEAKQRNRLLICSGLRPPEQNLIRKWSSALKCSEVVLCNDFYPRFSPADAVKSTSADQCFELFASSRFVITSSFHGCIFAAVHGKPFLPVAVKGQPPKAVVAAEEAMGGHAWHICSEGPHYVVSNYEEIAATILTRTRWLRQRAGFNVPEKSNHL